MTQPLYEQLLGERLHILPDTVRKLHDIREEVSYSGEGYVKRGTGLLSRLTGWFMGFPSATENTKISVHFRRDGDSEYWQRTFGEQKFYSRQWVRDGMLFEQINLITLVFNVETNQQKLSLQINRILMCGLPVPRFLYPKIVATETSENGCFCFFVKAEMPVIGPVVEYAGWLKEK